MNDPKGQFTFLWCMWLKEKIVVFVLAVIFAVVVPAVLVDIVAVVNVVAVVIVRSLRNSQSVSGKSYPKWWS